MKELKCSKCPYDTTTNKAITLIIPQLRSKRKIVHDPYALLKWSCPWCDHQNIWQPSHNPDTTMPFDFITEYLAYNIGNECPRNYHIWTGLTLLAAAVHKQVHNHWGYFDLYPNLFVCLVGKQGSRKSTAKDIGKDLFESAFKDYPIGSDISSREAIVKKMTTDSTLYSFKDEHGVLTEVRPMVFFINELKNFLSVDPGKMIAFLTDIYDKKVFKSDTIKHGLEDITNPCINLLACEVPSWITEKLKLNIISGGFARRVIYVYEIERGPRISFPTKPTDSAAMFQRLSNHLIKVSQTVGLFKWTAEARAFWDQWYQGLKAPDDEVMAGYYESKHIQALKVAMLLALSHESIELLITTDHLVKAIAMLDVLEVNMPKLSQGAGRNELGVPMQALLETLENNKGWLPEKTLKRLMSKDLHPMEQIQVLKFLQETEQIYVKDVLFEAGVTKRMVMTRKKYMELPKKQ